MQTSKQASLKVSIKEFFLVVIENFTRFNIGTEAAAMTYFLILSTVPILFVIANLIPLMPIPVNEVLSYMEAFLPPDIYNLVGGVIIDYLKQVDGNIISLGLLFLMWPASQALTGLQNALNQVYGATVGRNFIISRIFSFAIALGGAAIVGLVSFAFVFGGQIILFIENMFSIDLKNVMISFELFRWIVLIGTVLLLVILTYYFVPNVKWPLRYAIPGGIFTTVGYVAISQLFTLYVSFAGRRLTGNNTFGVFIVYMMWMYLTCMVLLVGGVINVIIYRYRHPETASPEKIEEKKHTINSEQIKKIQLKKARIHGNNEEELQAKSVEVDVKAEVNQ